MGEALIDITLFILLLACLYTDLKERKIYNKIIFSAVIIGLGLVACAYGVEGMVHSGKGFLLGAALLILPFAAGGIGAGDLKLLATIGLFKGPHFVFSVFLLAALLGGAFALLLLLRRGSLWPVIKNILMGIYILLISGFKVNPFPSLEQKNENMSILFPYAPALVAASFVVFFTGHW